MVIATGQPPGGGDSLRREKPRDKNESAHCIRNWIATKVQRYDPFIVWILSGMPGAHCNLCESVCTFWATNSKRQLKNIVGLYAAFNTFSRQ